MSTQYMDIYIYIYIYIEREGGKSTTGKSDMARNCKTSKKVTNEQLSSSLHCHININLTKFVVQASKQFHLLFPFALSQYEVSTASVLKCRSVFLPSKICFPIHH